VDREPTPSLQTREFSVMQVNDGWLGVYNHEFILLTDGQ
jgi:hypothetical protein